MERVVAGKVSAIPLGERKIVVPFHGRAGIGVVNVDGLFYTVRNICPHKNAPPSIRGTTLSVGGVYHFSIFEVH